MIDLNEQIKMNIKEGLSKWYLYTDTNHYEVSGNKDPRYICIDIDDQSITFMSEQDIEDTIADAKYNGNKDFERNIKKLKRGESCNYDTEDSSLVYIKLL